MDFVAFVRYCFYGYFDFLERSARINGCTTCVTDVVFGYLRNTDFFAPVCIRSDF